MSIEPPRLYRRGFKARPGVAGPFGQKGWLVYSNGGLAEASIVNADASCPREALARNLARDMDWGINSTAILLERCTRLEAAATKAAILLKGEAGESERDEVRLQLLDALTKPAAYLVIAGDQG